jgi:hypothetical protein
MTALGRALACSLLGFGAAACEGERTNPPTDPADPVIVPEAAAPPPTRPPEAAKPTAGAGPDSFVGRWSAQAVWCSNPSGAQRPIVITTTRFEGYENSCSIDEIVEGQASYDLTLTCQAEGTTAVEQVNLAAQGDSLRMSWPERAGAAVLLTRCPEAEPPA